MLHTDKDLFLPTLKGSCVSVSDSILTGNGQHVVIEFDLNRVESEPRIVKKFGIETDLEILVENVSAAANVFAVNSGLGIKFTDTARGTIWKCKLDVIPTGGLRKKGDWGLCCLHNFYSQENQVEKDGRQESLCRLYLGNLPSETY